MSGDEEDKTLMDKLRGLQEQLDAAADEAAEEPIRDKILELSKRIANRRLDQGGRKRAQDKGEKRRQGDSGEAGRALPALAALGFDVGALQGPGGLPAAEVLPALLRNWTALANKGFDSLEALRLASAEDLAGAGFSQKEVDDLLGALHYADLAGKGFDFRGRGLEYLLPEISRNLDELKSMGFHSVRDLNFVEPWHLKGAGFLQAEVDELLGALQRQSA